MSYQLETFSNLQISNRSCQVSKIKMTYNTYSSGSQWRKWDLHVHTPASFHWNGGKLLRDMDSQEKKDTFQKLFETLEGSDVAVFSFTDYWTFDGYVQFRKYLRDENLSCSKTVFPGMELRIEAPVDYRLNIQVILSDTLTEQQLEDFKSNLKIRSIDRRISDESIIEFARTLDASKARKHGFDDPARLKDNDLLKLGNKTIEVSKDSLVQAMQAVPKASAYILLPYDTSDGLEKLDWVTQPHADNYFMQTAHAFESRKEDTTNLFLGIETDKNTSFIENFQKTLNNVKKPVLCGSDAHRFSDYGNYPSNRITWIKADPTFRGFRQIFFEPRGRVRIQEFPPEEKTPYLVIDKVRFVDKTGSELFSDEWIEFNENLNTIIGGKSSGKSLLLYHIAKTITPSLVSKRSQEINLPEYNFGRFEDFDFEVMWKDGRVDKLSILIEHADREIEYIPQMYVNSLAEKQGKNSLYQLIESILEQETTYRDFKQQVDEEITELESEIHQHTRELLKQRDILQRLYKERKGIGSEEAITSEIQRLSSKIDILREESGFSVEEKEQYEFLQQKRQNQFERQRKYNSLNTTISDLLLNVDKLRNQVVVNMESFSDSVGKDKFSNRIIASLNRQAVKQIENAFKTIIKSQKRIEIEANSKANRCRDEAQRIEELLKPFQDKIRNQESLKKLQSDVDKQHKSLSEYNKKAVQIDAVKQAGFKARENLLKSYSDLFERYKRIASMLQVEAYSNIDEEIVLEAFLNFDTESFKRSFIDLFNLRNKLRPIFGSSFDEYNDFRFNESSHLETITSIYESLSSKQNLIKYKGGFSINDAISNLFKNCFLIEYNLRYKNDDILDMSPGKRGLVLLQMLLHISNAIHPILIDQPEDNLDNRTISNELRKFIKMKKLARQIIMVTHDANLVVLTDAENIIVSNQAGQQADRENEKFRFEHVTGALEHSFRKSEEETNSILFSCGVREHVCDILEGGEEAFLKREQRYGFSIR